MSLFCQLFGYTKQAYHKQRHHQDDTRLRERVVLDHVLAIRRQLPRAGVRKLHYLIQPSLEVKGIGYGRDKLFALLGREGLLVKKRKRYTKTTNSQHWMRKYPNLIKDRVPSRPEEIWVADITYVPGEHGHQYLHLITDAYSKQVMGYELSQDLEANSTLKALKMAIRHRKYQPGPLIHHSDRGLQYCSSLYTEMLKDNGIGISMTENGDPYENPVAERMNGILKDEFGIDLVKGDLKTNRQFTGQTIKIYNSLRPHLSCSMLTPVQMDAQDVLEVKTWRRGKEKASSNRVIT